VNKKTRQAHGNQKKNPQTHKGKTLQVLTQQGHFQRSTLGRSRKTAIPGGRKRPPSRDPQPHANEPKEKKHTQKEGVSGKENRMFWVRIRAAGYIVKEKRKPQTQGDTGFYHEIKRKKKKKGGRR